MTALFAAVSLLSMGAIGAVVACGDDDTAGVTNAPDGAAGDGAATSSSGASSSGASSSGAPGDAATDSPSSSSGDVPSDPGKYTCGPAVCDGGTTNPPGPGGNVTQVCCQAVAEANTKCATQDTCDNTGTSGNLRVTCDEAADCEDDGDICCYSNRQFGGGGGGGGGGGQPTFTASCRSRNNCRSVGFDGGTMVTTPRPQICKTTAECGDAGVCNPKTCDGFKLRVCGSPAGCQ